MAKHSVFDFKDYRHYLDQALLDRSELKKGQRLKLSKFIRCHPTYVTRILDGRADLSPEQAQTVSEFLGHTPAEARLFLNLVLLERAGTKSLKVYFNDEVKKIKDEKLLLKNKTRFNRTLTVEEQARYYSSWYFAAIHICISMVNLRTKEAIAAALRLPLPIVSEALEFLTEIDLLKRQGSEYRQGETSLFLSPDSPYIGKHHLNWMAKAIQSLDVRKEGDLHYSSVSTCSFTDHQKVRELFVQAVSDARKILTESKGDEILFAWTIHSFGIAEQAN